MDQRLSKKKGFRLTRKEKEELLSMAPTPGDILRLDRKHPHISDTTPYLHTDVLVVAYKHDDSFEFICKEHVPYTP